MGRKIKKNWRRDIYYYSGKLPEVEAETLPAFLKLRTELYPDEVYMARKYLGIWQTYTWRDVYDQIRTFHYGLLQLGLQPQETVCVGGENAPEMFWATYAGPGNPSQGCLHLPRHDSA